jgi:hypothetical protein
MENNETEILAGGKKREKRKKGQQGKDQIQRIKSWLTKPNDVMIKEM